MIAPATHNNSNPEIILDSRDMDPIVYIEFCHNCQSHLAIIRHQEKKYTKHFELLKQQLAEQGYQVRKKPVPKDLFKQSPYCPPNVYYRNSGQIVYFPQIGAFEIYFGGEKVFSKLQSKTWPTSDLLISLLKNQETQRSNADKKRNISEHPTQNLQKSQKQSESKAYTDQHTKTFYLRSRKSPLDNQRYSLQKRNLLKSSNRYKYIKSIHSKSKDQKQEDQKEAEIIKMYSPDSKKKGASERRHIPQLDGIPSIQGKARVKNANVYLAPIYPSSRVSYENYQKHRLIYAKKIHEEKMAYDASKQERKRQEVRQIPEVPSRKIRTKSRPKFNDHTTTLNKSIQNKKGNEAIKYRKEESKKETIQNTNKIEEKKQKQKQINVVQQKKAVQTPEANENDHPLEQKKSIQQKKKTAQAKQQQQVHKNTQKDEIQNEQNNVNVHEQKNVQANNQLKNQKEPSQEQNYEDAFENEDKAPQQQKKKVQPEQKQETNFQQHKDSSQKMKNQEKLPQDPVQTKENNKQLPKQQSQHNKEKEPETKKKEDPEAYEDEVFDKEDKQEKQVKFEKQEKQLKQEKQENQEKQVKLEKPEVENIDINRQ